MDILQTLSVRPDDLKIFLILVLGRVYAQEAPLYSTHLELLVASIALLSLTVVFLLLISRQYKPKRLDWIKNYFMQESAYAIMWEERTGRPITQLVTIISVDNHEPQIFIEHRDNWVRPLRETIAQYNAENSHNALDI